METPEAKERYKIRSKTVERPFAHLKQNMHLTEFRTTGLQEVNTELKLYTICLLYTSPSPRDCS